MRPDPHHQPPDDRSGRIIYLGDVRRRRAARRRAPDRHYLAALLLLAAIAWVAWLTTVMTLAPSRLLSYVAFFVPLSVALAASGALIAYGVDWRRGLAPDLGASGRRGIVLAAATVLNLSCRFAHHWSILLAAVTVFGVLAFEVVLTLRAETY